MQLYQNYLETQDEQYRSDARSRIASLYYQLGQQEWEKQTTKKPLFFLTNWNSFHNFHCATQPCFSKLKEEYQLLQQRPQQYRHKRVSLEGIIQLYQDYLETEDSEYEEDAKVRIASIFYQAWAE